tara:strand:+ start:1084 stop:1353 length:270 start_codon:yes stop_codon:yes gene_type:complete
MDMKTPQPITVRVQSARGGVKFPPNQEVTLKADGTGGPIISASGHIAMQPKKDCPTCGKKKSSCPDCKKSMAKAYYKKPAPAKKHCMKK